MDALLSRADIAGNLTGHLILDTRSNVRFYSGRWKTPTAESGKYVMRRPQLYGAFQWCYGEFLNGQCHKFTDFPYEVNSIRQRGCDVGWHLQMAIDKQIGRPQEYRIKISDGRVVLDFFSPIPLWAERRLIAIAKKVDAVKCLFSYQIQHEELEGETNFLRDYLWLSPVEE